MTPLDETVCAGIEADLSALLDGELAEARAVFVREHLAGCARCRDRVDGLRGVDDALAALPIRDVPTDLRARLQARLDAETPRVSRAPHAPGRAAPAHRRRWLSAPALAVATAAAAAVALYLALAPDRAPLAPVPRPEPPIAREPVPPQPDPSPEPVAPPEPVGVAEAPPPAPAVAPDPAPEVALDPALAAAPAEDLAVALELETVEDLEVIANLELLQLLVAMEEGTG